MRYSDFRHVITEGARIQHAEDVVFWEGSAGAKRALQSLKNLENGGHQDVTIKWDGSPAIIFGRNENGEFVLTDKSGFGAKGYNGKATSGQDLENMLLARGKGEVTSSRQQFAGNMRNIFDDFEKATSANFRGYFKGDLLYYTTPEKLNNQYSFKPNIVTYNVNADSTLGMKIGTSKCAVVVHRYMDLADTEEPVDPKVLNSVMQGNDVLVVPPVTTQKAPNVNNKGIAQLEKIVATEGPKIDELLNANELRQKQLTDFAQVLYTYTNSKVDTGLATLGRDFPKWLSTSKVSAKKQANILEHIGQHPAAFNALWKVVNGIIKVKDDIIRQFDAHDADVGQQIGTQKGGEGYVLAHPEGDIKLVPREFFSKANRAAQREGKIMRANEFVTEAGIPSQYDIKAQHKPWVEMGHKIRASLEPASGVKWSDDDLWNKAASLSTAFISLGAAFAPKTPAEALKKAGVDLEQAKQIMNIASSTKATPTSNDPVDEPEDDEGDFTSPNDAADAAAADRAARAKRK